MNTLFEYGEYSLTKISHCLPVYSLSYYKDELYLTNNEFTGTLSTEMGDMTQLSKLLCTHCLNSSLDFAFYMIICISLL